MLRWSLRLRGRLQRGRAVGWQRFGQGEGANAEGVAAGCPTVGIALSGNHVGLTVEALAAASAADLADYRASATKMLKDAGADYVIDTVADLPALLG